MRETARALTPTPGDRGSAAGPRRRRGLPLLLASLSLLIAACTGTREEQSSTLLLVGTQQAGTPQLILVEDRQDGTAVAERMRFVEGSRRPLNAPAISVDVTARELGRGTAWVLAREVAGGEVSAYLHRFDVSNIDVAAPAGFAEVGTALPLVAPGGGGILPPDQTVNPVICPSTVQASRDGTWLLVLDVPDECAPGSGGFPVVWLVNSAQGTATSLQADTPDQVLGVSPYTDQRQDDERGYFLVAGINEALVFAVDFEDATSEWFGQRTLRADPNRLLAAAGSGQSLLGLTDGQLAGVDLARPRASDALGPLPALSNGLRLVADPLGRSDRVVVLGPTQVEVHAGLEDDAPEPDRLSVAAAAATIDPLRAYAYLVVNGGVVALDLYTGGASGESLRSQRFDVPEISLPPGQGGRPTGAISWVRAADPAAAP